MDCSLPSAAGVGVAASGRLLIDSPPTSPAVRKLAVGAVTATAFGRRVVERFGCDIELRPDARRRLQVRDYPAAVHS